MHTRSRSTILSLATLLGAGALLVGCDDPPSAPGATGSDAVAPSAALSAADGTVAEALRNGYYDENPAIEELRYFGSTSPAQVAVSSTPADPFPREGSSYLVISSGAAATYAKSSTTRLGCASASATWCDVGGLEVVLTVPDRNASVTFDFRYFSWDEGSQDPFSLSVVDSVEVEVIDPTVCTERDPVTGQCIAQGTKTSKVPTVETLGTWTTSSELSSPIYAGKLNWGPHRRIVKDISKYRGKRIILRFEASDGRDRALDSGALIDNLRIMPSNVDDWKGPSAFGTMASIVPVPINSFYTLSTTLSDAERGGSRIVGAEYAIEPGTFAPMNLVGASGDEAFATKGIAHAGVDVYTVCARGIDRYGNVGHRQCIEQAAYDPTKSYAASSGWFQSLPGSEVGAVYDAYDVAQGYLGVSARYQTNKKGTTLQGAVRFRVQKRGEEEARLGVRSKSLTYLLIDNGLARIKGTGVLYRPNASGELAPVGDPSQGEYGFLVTMIDGSAPKRSGSDFVRVRIWHIATGKDVYDSQRGEWNPDDPNAFTDTAPPLSEVRGGQVKIQ